MFVTGYERAIGLTARVRRDAYYTDGRALVEIYRVSKLGHILVRYCDTEEIFGYGIDAFRAHFWLVAEREEEDDGRAQTDPVHSVGAAEGEAGSTGAAGGPGQADSAGPAPEAPEAEVARRAPEAAEDPGLADQPWIVRALVALHDQGRYLPDNLLMVVQMYRNGYGCPSC